MSMSRTAMLMWMAMLTSGSRSLDGHCWALLSWTWIRDSPSRKLLLAAGIGHLPQVNDL